MSILDGDAVLLHVPCIDICTAACCCALGATCATAVGHT